MVAGRRRGFFRHKDGNSGYDAKDRDDIARRAIWGYLTEQCAASSVSECEPYPYRIVGMRDGPISVEYKLSDAIEIESERLMWYLGYLGQFVAHQVLARVSRPGTVTPHYYDPRDPPLYEFGMQHERRELMVVPREMKSERDWLSGISQVPVSLIADLHAVDALPDALVMVELQLEERQGTLLGWCKPDDLLHREPSVIHKGEDSWLINDSELEALCDFT